MTGTEKILIHWKEKTRSLALDGLKINYANLIKLK